MDPVNLRYVPHGAAVELLEYDGPEVVVAGPAGTGKSVACLYKLHFCASRVPKLRALIVRKTRASLTESALVTFESHVLQPGHPALCGPSRAMRRTYRYPNGSEIVTGGLDKASKIFSTEWDLIFIQEAIELTEADWESLTTRLRNGVLPYQQLLADTNPDSPQHWLKQRCNAGRCKMLDGRHEDNPRLWSHDLAAWTAAGRTYISKLDALTGPRFHRLRHGRWVQAEGVVYEGWDRAIHLVNRFEILDNWARFWVIDFGFTGPFVCQFWAQDHDGRLYRYREIYHTQRLVEDHARKILELTRNEPRPRAVICDHDAEGRATLERHLGIITQGARKDVQPGIQAVAARLRKAGDGKPRLLFLRDSLVERDPGLVDAKKPTCTEEEFDSYVWNLAANRKKGEEPLKKNDHGQDALRYLVAHFDLKVQAGRPGFLGGGVTGVTPYSR